METKIGGIDFGHGDRAVVTTGKVDKTTGVIVLDDPWETAEQVSMDQFDKTAKWIRRKFRNRFPRNDMNQCPVRGGNPNG